jgi:hypothetical protein
VVIDPTHWRHPSYTITPPSHRICHQYCKQPCTHQKYKTPSASLKYGQQPNLTRWTGQHTKKLSTQYHGSNESVKQIYLISNLTQTTKTKDSMAICPCCSQFTDIQPCALLHLRLSINHRTHQLDQLKNALGNQGTLNIITAAIAQGINHWTLKQSDSFLVQMSPTFGSLLSVDAVISQAYQEQTNSLGWDNFLH